MRFENTGCMHTINSYSAAYDARTSYSHKMFMKSNTDVNLIKNIYV